MALCSFCKKIKFRSSDIFFMIIICIALYFVYQHQINALKQKSQDDLKAFHKLQKECMMGDDKACQKVR